MSDEADLRGLPAVDAVRLLQSGFQDAAPVGGADATSERLRLRPPLDLAFPAGEFIAARERSDGRTEVVLGLPALYGALSPLPAYLTERLLAADTDGTRAFIDVLNHRLLSLTLRVVERASEAATTRADRLASWSGLAGRVGLLRWAALLRRPRSADDLGAVLVDRCAPHPVRVVSCVRVEHPLRADERACLGGCASRLGHDAVIGTAVSTRATAFRVEIGPLPADEVERYAPEGALHAAIAEAVALFNPDLLDWSLVLLIAGATLAPAALGSGAALSRSARLAGDALAVYPLVARTDCPTFPAP